jgi:hypothetical protein
VVVAARANALRVAIIGALRVAIFVVVAAELEKKNWPPCARARAVQPTVGRQPYQEPTGDWGSAGVYASMVAAGRL